MWLWFVLPQLDARGADALSRWSSASVAHGQAKGERFVFEVPPSPKKAPPLLAFDVHTGFSVPLDNSSLCPQGAGCVLQSGGGVGGSGEVRWPIGLGVLLGYDAWFLETDSVYELGVQQLVRLGLRYTMPTSVVFHPMFEIGSGVTTYGDTFKAATVGAALEVLAGSEFELSADFGLRAGIGIRVFSHTPFQTRDGIRRGAGGRFSESIFFQVGLTLQ